MAHPAVFHTLRVPRLYGDQLTLVASECSTAHSQETSPVAFPRFALKSLLMFVTLLVICPSDFCVF